MKMDFAAAEETGENASAATWAQVQAIDRGWLFEEGTGVLEDRGKVLKRGFPAETAEMVLD